MSLAYLQSKALTKLADCGPEALDKVEFNVREILGKEPGPWLPDEIIAGFELVEMAHRNSNSGGKKIISAALQRILDDLGKAWLKRSLNPVESRQLFSSMLLGVGWHAESPRLCRRLARILWEVKMAGRLFRNRVATASEIVGGTPDALEGFLKSLWLRIPAGIRKKQSKARRQKKDVTTFKQWATAYSKSALFKKSSVMKSAEFFNSRFSGEPVMIPVVASDKQHFIVVCPTGQDDALEVADSVKQVDLFLKVLGRPADAAKIASLDIGQLIVEGEHRLNLIEGAFSHARSEWKSMMSEIAAQKVSPHCDPVEVERFLYSDEEDRPEQTQVQKKYENFRDFDEEFRDKIQNAGNSNHPVALRGIQGSLMKAKLPVLRKARRLTRELEVEFTSVELGLDH